MTPGLAASSTVCRACAASLDALLIREIVSSSYLSPPACLEGAGLPTYSGRLIEEGTVRMGVMVPGTNFPEASLGMRASLFLILKRKRHIGAKP